MTRSVEHIPLLGYGSLNYNTNNDDNESLDNHSTPTNEIPTFTFYFRQLNDCEPGAVVWTRHTDHTFLEDPTATEDISRLLRRVPTVRKEEAAVKLLVIRVVRESCNKQK